MKILVLGGTKFLGRHVVEAARVRGHELTLFHRGQTNPGLFNGVEEILGDREGALTELDGHTWDAVIDTCGFLPRVVKASARFLADRVDHYTFISSGSVYAQEDVAGLDETAAVAPLSREGSEEIAKDYGALKALCEREVEDAMPGRALHVRFGLLVGPHDSSGRFTYWPDRIARGGDVLAPGDPTRQVQLIDVRDGAAWIVKMAEAGVAGVFNVAGPVATLSMGAMLETCRTALGSGARFVWVDEPFLLERGVAPWTELPLWLPEAMRGALSVSIRKALAAGLTCRPLADTVRDTLAWDLSRPADERARPTRMTTGQELRMGLTPERETGLLTAWRSTGR